jgi:hypothetical protein
MNEEKNKRPRRPVLTLRRTAQALPAAQSSPATAASPPASPSPSRLNDTRGERVAVQLVELRQRFPLAFNGDGDRDPRPLKVGIHRDLRKRAPDLDGALLRQVLKAYCGGPRYLAALVAGAVRIDLDGEPAGAVTAEEEARAIEQRVGLLAQDGSPPVTTTPPLNG